MGERSLEVLGAGVVLFEMGIFVFSVPDVGLFGRCGLAFGPLGEVAGFHIETRLLLLSLFGYALWDYAPAAAVALMAHK